jgi:hypothetical protein
MLHRLGRAAVRTIGNTGVRISVMILFFDWNRLMGPNAETQNT